MPDPISSTTPTPVPPQPQPVQQEQLERSEPGSDLRADQRPEESQQAEQPEPRRPSPDDRLGTQINTRA